MKQRDLIDQLAPYSGGAYVAGILGFFLAPGPGKLVAGVVALCSIGIMAIAAPRFARRRRRGD